MTHCKDEKMGSCKCPYCEGEIECTESPFCQPCGVSLRYCGKCGAVVPRNASVCPDCGSELARTE